MMEEPNETVISAIKNKYHVEEVNTFDFLIGIGLDEVALKIFEEVKYPLQDLENLSNASPIIFEILERNNLLVDIQAFSIGFNEEVEREVICKQTLDQYGLRYSEEKSWIPLFKNIKKFANEEDVNIFLENMIYHDHFLKRCFRRAAPAEIAWIRQDSKFVEIIGKYHSDHINDVITKDLFDPNKDANYNAFNFLLKSLGPWHVLDDPHYYFHYYTMVGDVQICITNF